MTEWLSDPEVKNVLRANHEMAKKTKRNFDRSLLTPIFPLSAQEVKEIRESCGMTQKEFCEVIGVKINHLSDIENGRSKPGGTLLKLLSLIKRKGVGLFLD